ncbi:MAG: c-type cytochrome [Sphingobacteriales bacterium]|nr:MAG: c-type cytochrome [Sphingobacteriales bacterium]
MKKFFKWTGIIIGLVLVVILGIVAYVKLALPNVGDAPQLKVEVTPERVQRGEYLANSVAVCIDCHSKRDWTQFSGPLLPGTIGGGGEVFDEKLGFPGTFYSKNITPYRLKHWSDGEIFRAITTGVNKEGRAIFPVMPYHNYGKMDKEDIYSIIAYLRTLPEVKNDVPESQAAGVFNVILNTIPHPAALTTRPAPSDTIKYGGYLVQMAACADCHTPFEKGQFVEGMEYAGGREFNLPMGTIRTPNLTPHATGLAAWDQATFISRFKMYAGANYHSPKLGEGDFNTIMPWMMYSRMTESDLASIYAYLRTVKPIENKVEKFTPKQQLASR